MRGVWAAVAPENFTLFAANTIQLIMFATLYYLMLTNGFGLLLLTKQIADHDLRDSEARFRSYFELPLIGIAITAPDKGWLDANVKLCEMLGYPKDELMQMTWTELTHPDDLAADLTLFNRVLAGEIDGYDLEKRFICKDGHTIFTHLAIQCVRHPDHSVNYVVALLEDITERQRAEEALKKSEMLYRLLAENISDVIWIFDINASQFRYISPSVERLSGYLVDEALRATLNDMLPPVAFQSAQEVVASRLRAFREGYRGDYVTEVAQPRKDGSTVWVEATIRYHVNEANGHFEIYGVSRDITERKRTEAALLESEARYQDLYENAPDMYLSVASQSGQILHCNQTVARLTGFEKPDLIGKPVFELYHPACLDAARQAMQTFLTTGEVHDAELQVRCKDGHRLDVSLNASAVRDATGQIVQSRSIWRDITDRKLAEDTLRELNATLEQRVADRTAELQAANRAPDRTRSPERRIPVAHQPRTAHAADGHPHLAGTVGDRPARKA